jgi:hypothetical protein
MRVPRFCTNSPVIGRGQPDAVDAPADPAIERGRGVPAAVDVRQGFDGLGERFEVLVIREKVDRVTDDEHLDDLYETA